MAAKKGQAEVPKSVASPLAPETPIDSISSLKMKKSDKKPMPVLNIAAATKAATPSKKSNPSSTVTSAVDKPDDSAFPALPTPGGTSVSSPATRGPKTLRVVGTPKTETPPAVSAGPSAPPPTIRHAYSGLQRPETPASSENVSDSASIISASVSASRTNSPPPISRIGSAAVRTTTKSQQRKARKEATKKEAAAIAVAPKVEPEVEIAPIMGRKKKQKKEKPAQPKETTPVVENRPVSPSPADKVVEKMDEKVDDKVIDKESKPVVAAEEKVSVYRQAVNESISLDEGLVPRPRRKEDNISTGEMKPNADRPIPTPAAIAQELANEGLIASPGSLIIEKPVSSTSHRPEHPLPVPKNGFPDMKYLLTQEHQEALLAGKSVHMIVDGQRTMFTPNGDCIRNLTAAEEQRYLFLQRRISANHGDPTVYVHPRYAVGGGFSVIKGRAVANGPPSFFPQGPLGGDGDDDDALPSVEDPVHKMTREEALGNINQSILTRFNLGTMNLSSLVDRQHASPDPLFEEPASPHQHTAQAGVSKNVLKTLEPLFNNLTANALQSQDASGEAFSGLAQTMPSPPTTKVPSAAKGSALAGITSMSPEDMEASLAMARKEVEKLERSLNQVIKKNRRLLSLSSSAGSMVGTGDAHVMRKREVLRRGVARVGLGTAAHFGIDARTLGVSYGFALRATVAAFLMLERIALWALVRAYKVAAWTARLIVAMLDWIGATY
ncbi:transcriptional repressor general negative regulator of transcription subunit 4 [Gnomoniopsis smithogilvyi]|uniref:Transcriptional repressor general negative regulator of transcription subunit 4 n=1 Tax=Gnomoniopsis smithogilvyi TaxID=1191159 RepID=A0A9W8YYY7_9PEZI|nr:transcriptional repressor general negative regulator of transcription subunit 4 [Gnomoniopsis smithogilvyi]